MYNLKFSLYTHSLSLRKNILYQNMFKQILHYQINKKLFLVVSFIKTCNFIILIYFENNYVVVKQNRLFEVINVFNIE